MQRKANRMYSRKGKIEKMSEITISKRDYQIACKEVLEILKVVKKDDFKKIPKDEIETLNKNANNEYEFTYNPKININDQNVSKVAKAIIANYFIDYIATPEQKQKIINKQIYDIKNSEKEKKEKYINKNPFKEKINNVDIKNNIQIISKKESPFIIIIKKIKKFFDSF